VRFNTLHTGWPARWQCWLDAAAPDRRLLVVVLVPSQDNPFFKARGRCCGQQRRWNSIRVRVDAHNDDCLPAGQSCRCGHRQQCSRSYFWTMRALTLPFRLSACGQGKASSASSSTEPSTSPGLRRRRFSAITIKAHRLVAAEFARALGRKGDYVELLGRESDTNARVTDQGFSRPCSIRLPRMKMVSAQSANWSQAEAFSKDRNHVAGARGDLRNHRTERHAWRGCAASVERARAEGGCTSSAFDGSPDAMIPPNQFRGTWRQPH